MLSVSTQTKPAPQKLENSSSFEILERLNKTSEIVTEVSIESAETQWGHVSGSRWARWSIGIPSIIINTVTHWVDETNQDNLHVGRDAIIRSGVDMTFDSILGRLGWGALFAEGYLSAGRYIANDPESLQPTRSIAREIAVQQPPKDLSWWKKSAWYELRAEIMQNDQELQTAAEISKLYDAAKQKTGDVIIGVFSQQPIPQSSLLNQFGLFRSEKSNAAAQPRLEPGLELNFNEIYHF